MMREEPVREPKSNGKPFAISKRLVWEAWRRVKANDGAEGVDEESIQAFEANLRGNLFKVWNRMSSGSYMPPPVRAVEVPKKSGGSRLLGVPTVTSYHKVVQAAFGFAGCHASVSSAARRASCGVVRSPCRCRSRLCV
jgi:retron-type reverse transcriptase